MSCSSSTDRPKTHGVTTPRSFDQPTQADRESTDRLVKVLAHSYPPKSEEEGNRQKAVLEKLAKIVNDWVKELATERVEEVNAKLFNFGSYFLQVDDPGSVIDTLCVGPNFVNHEHGFLHILPGKLEKMAEVAGMECVPDALIPFLSFTLCGVPIKLIYASISCSIIPEDLDIADDFVLENSDDVTFRSLSACRVATSIPELVPDLETFRTSLRCVKYWAKERGIWSNVSGFLGESAWFVLVARVCQVYPTALPSTIVIKLFDIFANWCWPNPIILGHIKHMQLSKQNAWDPRKYEGDKAHCMPIIAPAYPCTNLTSDATESTLRMMKEHFKLGDEKCKEIDKNANWEDLFVPFDFFEKYPRYLHIEIIADSEKNLRTLKRWVEPKLHWLISEIQKGKKIVCHPCSVELASRGSGAFFIALSSNTLRMGIQFVNIVSPLTKELQTGFDGWESKTPDMVLRDAIVGRGMSLKSLKWAKSGLPVLEQKK